MFKWHLKRSPSRLTKAHLMEQVAKHKKQTSKVECPVCEEIIDDSNLEKETVVKWQHRKCAGLSKTAFENARTSPTAFCCPAIGRGPL